MILADSKLQAIKVQLGKGIVPQKETVRSFLSWFNVDRRGWRVCKSINSTLERHGLITTPNYEYAFIDGPIQFSASTIPLADNLSAGTLAADPTYRIGRLEAANNEPTYVKPDSTLSEAVTIMLTRDFSQIPVMTNIREVKGVISWKTIGSCLSLGKKCDYVRECMEPAREVQIDDSLLGVIETIAKHDYVLVRTNDKSISGIITASDFSIQFQKLAEPFLLVGEIENGVRKILHGKFTKEELGQAKAPGDDSRAIEAISDLTFGEYIRLIESETRWKKLKLVIDRVEFIRQLNRIREIRNDVMHFDPDGLEESDFEILREFAQFLKRLRDVGVV